MPAYSDPTWTNGSGTPMDQTHLQAISDALAQALQADGTGPTISTKLAVAGGAGFKNSIDSAEFWGPSLNGSALLGIQSTNNAVTINSGQGCFLSFNSAFDGTNDHFLVSSQTAYQFKVGANGIQWRKSTGTGAAGSAISWTAYTTIAS